MDLQELIINTALSAGVVLPQIPQFKSGADYIKYQVDMYNRTAGHLNDDDRINCPKCLNRGYIETVNDLGDISTRICTCMQQRKEMQTIKNCGLDKLFEDNFENFVAEEEWQERMKSTAIRYAEIKTNEWFYIGGQSGAGKTHICTAICNRIVEQGKSFRYLLWDKISETMKKPNSDSYFELQNIIDNTDVIYIDDFLKPIAEKIIKKKTLSFADEDEIQKIYPIINARNIRDKKTIISSELYIDEIRNLDEATAGRIKEKAGKYIVHIKRDPSRNHRFKEVEVI